MEISTVSPAKENPLSTVGLPACSTPRVRSHGRFRNRGTEYISKYVMKWMSGNTKRQSDNATEP